MQTGKRSLGLVALIVLIAIASSCANITAKRMDDGDTLMYGMVYDYENNPVSAVRVSIDGKPISETDLQGRFVLDIRKKGQYRLTLEKQNYERVETEFEFDPLNALYLKMMTASQLIKRAENLVDSHDFERAFDSLDRALVLEPYRCDAMYLEGVILYRQKKYDEALSVLSRLPDNGYSGIYGDLLKKKIETKNTEGK